MAIKRRVIKAVYDVDASAGGNPATLGEDITKTIGFKGYCCIKTDGSLLGKAIEEANQMSAVGRFGFPPAMVVDGLLGEEGSVQVAELPAEVGEFETMSKLDSLLSDMVVQIAESNAALELGIRSFQRTEGLLHESGILKDELPELPQDQVMKWLSTFVWHRLMLVLFLGPNQGLMELTPFDGESEAFRVLTEPGMLMVLRADTLWRKHSAPVGKCLALSCFVQQAGRQSGQGALIDPPTNPIAEQIDQWALDKLEASVENEEEFDKLNGEWKRGLEHLYHKGQQYAVRGFASKHPSTWDADEFWHSTNACADIITEVPLSRWNHSDYYSDDPDGWKMFKVNVKHCSMIDGLELFDAKFFRISPGESKSMDPLQRQILETGYSCLFKAGRNTKSLLQSLTAVYIGCHLTEFTMIDAGPEESGGCEQRAAGTGIAGSIMSNRFSFVFGMNGPSVQFDTDASSGMAALETGTVALDIRKQNATLSMCLAVTATLTPLTWFHRIGLGQMAPVGRTFAFDHSSDGWVKSEGSAAVAIDNLVESVEGFAVQNEGQYYLGTLGAVKLQHAGFQSTLGAPSGPAVQNLIVEACRQANISPCSLDFVECNANGMVLNDAVEVLSTEKVCCRETNNMLFLGSLKTNYGNSVQCSSMSMILKTLFSQAYGWMPPTCHLQAINPQIEETLDKHSVIVNSDIVLFPSKTTLAGVSSMGWGGTIGHTICSCGVDPLRVAATRPMEPCEALVYWPGGGGGYWDQPEKAYYIVGSWSEWAQPQPMTREAAGLWTFFVTLGVNRFEEFHILFDGKRTQVLHAAQPQAPSGSTAMGPSDDDYGCKWLIDGRAWADGRGGDSEGTLALASPEAPSEPRLQGVRGSLSGIGDRYLVKLSIAGKWRAVTWEKIESSQELTLALTDPKLAGTYYVLGTFTTWKYEKMEASADSPGIYSFEVRLMRPAENFQIVRNKDRGQVLFPGSCNAVSGPALASQAATWLVDGEAGDIVRIELQRSFESGNDTKKVSWRKVGTKPLNDEEQAAARQRQFFIIGTWSNFNEAEQMVWNGTSYICFVSVGDSGQENFQIICGGWMHRLCPSIPDATADDAHSLFRSWGDSEHTWLIGPDSQGAGSAGAKYEVELTVDHCANPSGVSWRRID